MADTLRIAILGAGPIGVEAAARFALDGHQVRVYERGPAPGHHVRRWSHVPFFSPWALNRSAWGTRLLEHEAPSEGFPSGADYLASYLEPLARHPLIADRVHFHHLVRGVARAGMLKGDAIGQRARGEGPFFIELESPSGPAYAEADLILDATGSYDRPAPLGPGGLHAIGERALSARIERYIPDPSDESWRAERVLVVGDGYSALSSIAALREAGAAKIFWLRRDAAAPAEPIPDDPLPQRAELARLARRAAADDLERVRSLPAGWIYELAAIGDGAIRAIVRGGEKEGYEIEIDRIVSNVGYRPDTSIFRELQIHLCYASDGPMKLAASLMAAGGGGGDCLAQSSAGVEALMSPEPDFFIVGMKSYGRGSAFLLRLGFEQIDEIARHLAGREA